MISVRHHTDPFSGYTWHQLYRLGKKNDWHFGGRQVGSNLDDPWHPQNVGFILHIYTDWAKNGLFLRVDNFATVNVRKACDISKV